MRSVVAAAAVAAALLSASTARAQGSAAAARPRSAARAPLRAHPAVGTDQDCRGCHAAATRASFDAWSQSKHGLDLVTCVVCHGSTGADFTRRPTPDRCTGCHPAQAATLASAFMKGRDCFACHPGHALDPHASGRDATAAVRVGADVELRRELGSAGPVNGPNPAADAAGKPAAAAGPAAPPPAPERKDTAGAQPHPPPDRP